MSQHAVPEEVAQCIVRCTDKRGVVTLARTSRSLQTAAEKRLYHTIEVVHSPKAFAICQTLASRPRVAVYVRNFMLTLVTQRHRDRDRDHAFYLMQQTAASQDYWEVVQKALENLRTLDYLFLSDPTFRNSWIVRPTDNWTLQAKEIRLFLPWDTNITRFLRTQNDLRNLCIAEVSEESLQRSEVQDTALPHLTHFEGPLLIIDQLLRCPITHLKLSVASEEDVVFLPVILKRLHQLKTLRNLSVTPIPEEVLLPTLATISTACPNLKYLSHLTLPIEHKEVGCYLLHYTGTYFISTANHFSSTSYSFDRALIPRSGRLTLGSSATRIPPTYLRRGNTDGPPENQIHRIL